jgi:hypothetical protein
MTIGADEWTAVRKGTHLELRHCPCGPADGYLLIGNRCRDFSLRLRHLYGEEILTLAFTTEGSKRINYRKVTAHLFSGGSGRWLESARPKRGPLGNWALDLGGRFALPSRKNARIEGEGAGPVYIRKYRGGGLEVQTTDSGFSPIVLFAMCVASFVARK